MRPLRRIVALAIVLWISLGVVPIASGSETYLFAGSVGGSSRRVVHAVPVTEPSTLRLALVRSSSAVRVWVTLRDPSGVVVARVDASTIESEPLVATAELTGTWRVVLRAREEVGYELTVKVAPRNRAPVAVDDAATAVAGEPALIPVLANDADPDGDGLALATAGPASHGEVAVADPATVRYTPEAGFSGADAFAYQVCDDGTPTRCATATVSVEVTVPQTTRPTTAEPMPLVKGLSTRRGYDSRIGAYIVRVTWAELQPEPGGPIVHPNPIDAAIARGVPFRVRLLAGAYAPSWVLALGSVTIVDPFLGQNETYVVPRWWTRSYADAYADLVAKLAAEYDGRIPAITMSGPMTVWAEPFLHQFGSTATREAALAAGWSTATERAAFLRMIEAHAAFRRTRTLMAINPGQTYDPTTGRWNLADLSYTKAITDAFVQTLGARAIVQNNSLNVTRATKNDAYVALYEYMQELHANGVPIAFQTAQKALVEDLPWVLDHAVALGAHLVELPEDWATLDTPEHLALVDQRLRANEP